MFISRIRAGCSVALFVLVAGAAPAVAQETEADQIVVTALHAIPGDNGFPADVYLNGELAIEGFTKMMRTDPFTVEPGELLIEIYPTGADPDAEAAAVSETIPLDDPGNFAVVAQLSGDGQPILSLYVNDISPVDMGQGRFVFRQTSSVGPVDVLADGEAIATGLSSTEEVAVSLPAGTVELTVVPSAGGDPLVTTDVELVEGELTAVYAISTLEGDSLDVAVQTVTGLASAPSSIETGTGGHAASGSGSSLMVLSAAALLIAGAVAMWRRLVRVGR